MCICIVQRWFVQNTTTHESIMEQAQKKGPLREYDDLVASFSSSSTSSSVLSGISSGSSLESDSFDEVTSPASSSSSSANDQLVDVTHPLSDMSSLFQQLPIKRGLSKFYQGKSQSFTSLTNVRSLEDLAKPENPYNKRLKSCKSYAGGLAEGHYGVSSPRVVSKTTSRGSCSSLSARRGSNTNFIMSSSNSRPPIPSHRSTSTTIPNQTVLFA